MQSLTRVLPITCLLFFFLLTLHSVFAQTGIIKGTIKDATNKPVQYANVLLLKSADSSLVKGTVTDATGRYSFENIKNGEYYVSVSFTGMQQAFTKLIEINTDKTEIDQGILYLKEASTGLKEVTVTAKKPLYEQKNDRVIINIKSSITNAGATALEILEKSPGITVNRQNNSIAMNGKTGVSVMMNGKLTYMPTDALVQLLAGIPAASIEKIELITTPPSKYDAEGNAGYINIVLTNNPNTGFNGSYFLTAGYGHRELGAAGINFNYRKARMNLYGNYTVNYEHTIQLSTAFTQYTRTGNTITNTSFSNRDAKRPVQNARIGLDYQLDSSTIIGALVSGYRNHWSMVAQNGTTINKNNTPDTIIHSTDDPEMNLWQNIMANLNFQHTFKPGHTLFFDANYIYYKDNNPNNYSTDYYNGAKELLYHEDVKSSKITPIHFKVFSSDYTTPLGKKITMEAGAKISLSSFRNEVGTDNLKQGVWVPDTNLSANYLLKENIAAAYTSFTMNLGHKVSVMAGLRYEYTSSNLSTTQTANIINRKYGELFPTFYLSKKFNETNNINFSYSRRITRPAFTDLAPFTIFFDPKTFFSGNPALQPAIAHAVQASYVFKKYSLSVSYTHETNTINNFYFQTKKLDTLSGIVYLSPENYAYENYLTASVSLPFSITQCWSMQNAISCNWRQVNTKYEQSPLLFRDFDYSFNSTQQFVLPRNFLAELTAFYSSAGYFGTTKRKPLYQLDAGIQKKFSNKKDILRITANDIFNSGSDYRFGETLPGAGAIVNREFNFQLVSYKLTFTHNFGNNALKGTRERPTGAEDELKRVHN
jgi:hypothetical protein